MAQRPARERLRWGGFRGGASWGPEVIELIFVFTNDMVVSDSEDPVAFLVVLGLVLMEQKPLVHVLHFRRGNGQVECREQLTTDLGGGASQGDRRENAFRRYLSGSFPPWMLSAPKRCINDAIPRGSLSYVGTVSGGALAADAALSRSLKVFSGEGVPTGISPLRSTPRLHRRRHVS